MNIKLRKLQSGGGFPPLTNIYTPVTVTNPYTNPFLTALTQITMGGSTKDSKAASSKSSDDKLGDAVKLLKDMNGLDNDVDQTISALQQQAQERDAFGTSGDPVNDYYQNIQLINKVKQSNEMYKQAKDTNNAKNGFGDIATTNTGQVVMKGKSGDITFANPEQVKKFIKAGYQAMTNGNLLYERQYNPNYTFAKGDVLSRIVSESSSMQEIQKVIKDFSDNLGTNSTTQAGYVTKANGQIAQGVEILKNLGESNIESMPQDGIYKLKITNESNAAAAAKAIAAIYNVMTPQQRALLKVQTKDGTDKEAQQLIGVIVAKGVTTKIDFDMEYQKPDKDTDKTKKGSGAGGSDDASGLDKEGPMAAWFRGAGQQATYTISGATGNGIITKANIMPMIDTSGKPLPANSTLTDLTGTALNAALDISHASMGNGAELSPNGFDQVLLDGQIAAAELPVTYEDGKVLPNLKMLKLMDSANNTLELNHNISVQQVDQEHGFTRNKQIVNSIYAGLKLPPRYSNNGQVNQLQYKRFAMVHGTTTEKAFKDDDVDLTSAELIAGDQQRQNYVSAMKTKPNNSKFDVSNGFLGLGKENIYTGTIFIPMTDNYEGVVAGSGGDKSYLDSATWNNLTATQSQNQRMRSAPPKNINFEKMN